MSIVSSTGEPKNPCPGHLRQIRCFGPLCQFLHPSSIKTGRLFCRCIPKIHLSGILRLSGSLGSPVTHSAMTRSSAHQRQLYDTAQRCRRARTLRTVRLAVVQAVFRTSIRPRQFEVFLVNIMQILPGVRHQFLAPGLDRIPSYPG